ncbi:MAG: type II toxin-antitoxin system VapC family toxin [Nocardioidaceae bacterium]|nr:type II toxin-antitoxin system VapC family toxin [Nocardioidaceae bacterium]MCL2612915.1 type II toxin-antitoxin system VapC family toxin [Nocardioidaceae bacterium]
MLVVDASVLVTALTDAGAHGETARARLRGEQLRAPELIDVEVISVLRGRVAGGKLPEHRAQDAVNDLAALSFPRASHRPLAGRIWALRHDLSAYDAAYVALAELLEVPLLTADARLSRASGPRCAFEVLG